MSINNEIGNGLENISSIFSKWTVDRKTGKRTMDGKTGNNELEKSVKLFEVVEHQGRYTLKMNFIGNDKSLSGFSTADKAELLESIAILLDEPLKTKYTGGYTDYKDL
jgi:hypothetical protein